MITYALEDLGTNDSSGIAGVTKETRERIENA
jgi:hypothetical protein